MGTTNYKYVLDSVRTPPKPYGTNKYKAYDTVSFLPKQCDKMLNRCDSWGMSARPSPKNKSNREILDSSSQRGRVDGLVLPLTLSAKNSVGGGRLGDRVAFAFRV